MLVRQVCVALAIAALTGAVPAPIKHVLHEKRDKHSYDWVKGARVEKDAVLPVRIGLTQNNLEKGDEYLMEVYVRRSVFSAASVVLMFT
jgi:tripeptidyl-peptidase-1